jgi:hypothetical protein
LTAVISISRTQNDRAAARTTIVNSPINPIKATSGWVPFMAAPPPMTRISGTTRMVAAIPIRSEAASSMMKRRAPISSASPTEAPGRSAR